MSKPAYHKHIFNRLTLLWLLVTILSITDTKAQSQQEAPYNRFQWHKYKWKTFHTKLFHIYFPEGCDSLASFITAELPEAMKRVKRSMGTSLLKEPNVILYPSIDQLYESNIGLYQTEQNTFPTYIARGNRLVLAYTGNYEHLKTQLYEALARSIWESQLRQNLGDQIKSKTGEEEIPYWYREGAIRYFANQWPIQAEDQLKRSFKEQGFHNWQQSIAYQPKLSGQAFCYFLNEQYYPQASMQLFGQLKKKKNLARALRLITKKPIDTVLKQCHSFYAERFGLTDKLNTKNNKASIIIPKAKGVLRNLQTTVDNNQTVYTVYNNGKRTTYQFDNTTKQTKKLYTYSLPPWINDYSSDNYPLLQWTKDEKELLLTSPEKGKLTIKTYINGEKSTQEVVNNVGGILQLYKQDRNSYLLSGYRKGQSDIVSYDVHKEKYTTFTSDAYDDNGFSVNNKQQIAFISDRKEQEPTDEQKRTIGFKDTSKRKQGLYILSNKKNTLLQYDSLPYARWDKPVWINDNTLLATHTKAGTERFAIINPSNPNTIAQTIKDYSPVQFHQVSNKVTQYQPIGDSIQIITTSFSEWIATQNDTTISPWLNDYNKRAAARAKEDSIIKKAKDDNPSFLEGVLLPKNAKEHAKQREDSIAQSLQYDNKKVKPYVLQLHSAYFSAKVNNDYFINRYQPYKNYQGQFKFPELGGMAQGGFTDILENHHVNVGFRLPAGSEGSDFFIKYENTAKRIDWSVTYFRKVESLNADPKRNWTDANGRTYPNNAKVKTHYGEVSVSHPFTYYLKAGFTEAIRYDRTIFLATDKYSLTFEDYKSVWSISTLSLTYNKMQPTLPMLHKGIKAKATIDVFQPLGGNEGTVTGNTVQLQYHKPIYKYITWVSQLQAGYSGGQSKVLYNLGGMDNNVTVRIDSTVQPKQNVPYAFQTIITPLRGYLQNTITGNQYVNLNNDLYFPLFQSLIPIETPLSFINNLQMGVFSDIASARETWNTTNLNNGKWYWSYGLNARTTLAGYPIRVDVAWPGTFNKQAIWYFSLNVK